MKTLIIFYGLFISSLSYAAGTTQDLTKIFELIKSNKVSEAESKMKSGPSYYDGGYEKGLSIDADSPKDSLKNIVETSKKFFQVCDAAVADLKEMKTLPKPTRSKIEDDSDSDEEDNTEETPSNPSVEECKRLGHFIEVKISNYSDVDFDPTVDSYRVQFDKQIQRIKNIPHEAELEKKKKADAQKKEYEQSPEFYKQKLCQFQQQVDAGQRVIDSENSGAKHSGIVDKRVLYNAGQIMSANEKMITKYSAEMKSKFGKSWSKSDCK